MPNSNLPGLRLSLSHLNDMEIPGTKRFIPKGFKLGTTSNIELADLVYQMSLFLGVMSKCLKLAVRAVLEKGRRTKPVTQYHNE